MLYLGEIFDGINVGEGIAVGQVEGMDLCEIFDDINVGDVCTRIQVEFLDMDSRVLLENTPVFFIILDFIII